MGLSSPARLPLIGKLNEDWEICLNAYSIGFDSINNIMLTPDQNRFDQTTVKEIRSRFAELKKVARRNAPQKLRTIESLERLAILNHTGKISDRTYLHRLRLIALSNGVDPGLLNQAEVRINAVEGARGGHPPMPMQPRNMLTNIFGNVDRKLKKANKQTNSWMRMPRQKPRPARHERRQKPQQHSNTHYTILFGKKGIEEFRERQAAEIYARQKAMQNPQQHSRRQNPPVFRQQNPMKLLKKMFGGR